MHVYKIIYLHRICMYSLIVSDHTSYVQARLFHIRLPPLLLGLFPSSGVAGIVMDLYLPLCPVHQVLHI